MDTVSNDSPNNSTRQSGSWLREMIWLFYLTASALLAVALLSHDLRDPGFTTTGLGDSGIHNYLGTFGAELANVMYFLFGYSAWCLLALGIAMTLQAYKKGGQLSWRVLPAVAWLLCVCALEWLRFNRFEHALPGPAGGMVGYTITHAIASLLADGHNETHGLSLLFLAMSVMLSAWALGFSWVNMTEKIGAGLAISWTTWREKREAKKDMAAGQAAARVRAHAKPERTAGLAASSDAHALDAHQNLIDSNPHNSEWPNSFVDTTLLESRVLPNSPAPFNWSDIEAEAPITTPFVNTTVMRAIDLAQAGENFSADNGGERVSIGSTQIPAPAAATSAPARTLATGTVAAVVPSIRALREKQNALFDDLPDSPLPEIGLLDAAPTSQESVSQETLEMTSRLIEKKLKDFGVNVHVVAAMPGPVITRYEIEPATGVKGSQIVNLAKDLARSLSLVSIRVIETIPGKNYMALELPNTKRQSIRLSEILGSQVYNNAKSLLTIGLGKDIIGTPVVADLAKMPHVLVAGTTGSGKSVGINAMILSLLYKAEPSQVRMLMIDPKMLEMSVYEGIPHLIAPVVTDMKQAAHGLNWCVAEMEKRYKLMSKLGVRNLASYNTKLTEAKQRNQAIANPFSLNPEAPEPLETLPYIVVVIDELADLMMVVGKKIEELIARLAQKARAAGIHLVLATQRPSVDVITGLIKANIPTRIAFQVSSKIDSRTILDQMGAEALLGMGDMLYLPAGTGFPIRVHGAFVSDEEVHRVVAQLKERSGEANYIEGVLEANTEDPDGLGFGDSTDAGGEKDPLYDQAVQIVLQDRKASISYVQRKLKIGYNRAARLLEDMETAGLVSSLSSSGQRDILVARRGDD